MSSSIEIFPDSDILVAAAGKRLVGAIGAAVAARGQALIVLTGADCACGHQRPSTAD